MANKITAGNATNGGTSISSDTSGVLQLLSGSTPTTAINIDASQVVTINGLTVGKGNGSVSTNTVVGYQALNSNTSGDRSVAVGYQASASNTSGINTAVGYLSLNANTSGTENTAIGFQSMAKNTTGNYNSGLSDQALYNNTTGSNNVGVGFQALVANTTASNNTAVGYQAGYSNTTGANNTFLGYQAGQYSVALTTGSQCTYLGSYVAASSSSVNYEIVIGYAAQGKGTQTAFIAGTSGAYNGANSATWSVTSDQRIKENIVTLENGLSTIMALRPVEFDYIETKKHDISFIAQEYQKVLPDQVTEHAASPTEKEIAGTDTLLGITPNLVPYLVKALQEQQAMITDLQAKLKAANVAGF